MRTILVRIAKAMTTQAQAATVQAQAMKVQANRDISPHPHQQVTTVDSNLRDFSRINPPIFYGYKIYEYPYEFIDEFYKILHAIGVS